MRLITRPADVAIRGDCVWLGGEMLAREEGDLPAGSSCGETLLSRCGVESQ